MRCPAQLELEGSAYDTADNNDDNSKRRHGAPRVESVGLPSPFGGTPRASLQGKSSERDVPAENGEIVAAFGDLLVSRPSRRSLFTAVGAAAVLGGCAASEREPEAAAGATQAPVVSERPGRRAGPSARPSAPAIQALPDRNAIVSAFAGRTPLAWGLEPPGVALSLPDGTPAVALTLDCCGGPGGDGFDPVLLSALQRHRVPATFFLNARWLRSNRALARDLAANPLFEIANHGTAHRPLSVTGMSAYGLVGTANAGMVYDEIMTAQAELAAVTGRVPRFFRSGTAHYDEVAVEICRALGLVPVNFTVNGDGGATYAAADVSTELLAARPGSIIIAHANRPEAGTGAGIAAALPRMIARGTTFMRLSEIPPV